MRVGQVEARERTEVSLRNVRNGVRPGTWLAVLAMAAVLLLSGCSGMVSSANSTGNPTSFSIAGTISPLAGGNGATLTLSGAASATATADSAGNYTFTGLANGTYTTVPSHAGFTFTPSSQSMTVNGANVAGMNFTANGATVAPTITTPPANQTVAAGQTATFTVVAGGTAPLSYQWQKKGANITGATSASYK